MSKAFTRESDDAPDLPPPTRPLPTLPPGARNYLTPGGASRLRAELDDLAATARPAAATRAEATGERRDLMVIDQRIAHLRHSLGTATIVPPPPGPWEQVKFGATVTVRHHDGGVTRYRIVGVDETDLDRGWVSWLSPIARALVNARVGNQVRLRLPSGMEELLVTGIDYE